MPLAQGHPFLRQWNLAPQQGCSIGAHGSRKWCGSKLHLEGNTWSENKRKTQHTFISHRKHTFRKRGKQPQTKEELSVGQKLVGISFNPSGDSKVNRAKELCAELADLMMDAMNNREMTKIHKVLMDNTLCEILNAQMNVVKVLTFKY